MREHTLDRLTWLPGRQAFEERLAQAVRGGAGSARKVAAMMIDLDRMAAVNELLGTDWGDRVLRHAAARMARSLGPRISLARLQEDDFAAFVLVDDLAAAIRLADRVVEACRTPHVLGCVAVTATVSIGVALYPAHGRDWMALLRRAEDALHSAKALGGNRSFPGATCCGGTGRPPRTGHG